MSIFEVVMLLCFGLAWPASIWKSYKSRENSGKSIVFLFVILTGYIAGILHKVFFHYDMVIWLYVVNGLMVATDIGLYCRNGMLENSSAIPEV